MPEIRMLPNKTVPKVLSTRRGAAIALAAVVFALALGVPVIAESHDLNVSSGLTAQGAPLALRGYDPVSYFTRGKAELGSASHAVAHEGATYRFVSERHRRRFESDPERYLPQYGGFCAYGVSVGAKFDGDPQVFEVVDDKLYFNLNPDIQELWRDDIPGAVRKADANWNRIEDADPVTLSPQG